MVRLLIFEDDTPDDIRESLSGVMNSMRFGLVKIGSVSSKSDIRTIQNIACNNNCQMIIFEPNKKTHSAFRLRKRKKIWYYFG